MRAKALKQFSAWRCEMDFVLILHSPRSKLKFTLCIFPNTKCSTNPRCHRNTRASMATINATPQATEDYKRLQQIEQVHACLLLLARRGGRLLGGDLPPAGWSPLPSAPRSPRACQFTPPAHSPCRKSYLAYKSLLKSQSTSRASGAPQNWQARCSSCAPNT